MAISGLKHKLVAILYADIVGFSRHVGIDEMGAHQSLTQCRATATDSARVHQGRIIQHAGDSIVGEFPTASHALACALAIQERIQSLNLCTDGKLPWCLRMGIHLGEIHVRGDDVFGDSVNIAARLESLAEPGGICVSESVRQAVGSKLPVRYDFLGEQSLKNIQEPVRPYRVQKCFDASDSELVLADGRAARRLWPGILAGVTILLMVAALSWYGLGIINGNRDEPVALEPDNRPSIAVLPFDNLSDDSAQEHFSDGLTNDIITDLSQFSNLFVIAANSTFRYKDKPTRVQDIAEDLNVRYVLEGSVQRMGETVRINAQLIDAPTGHHVWAEKYDRAANSFFDIQNEISARIVGIIGPIGSAQGKLQNHELKRLLRAPTHSLSAYDHYLKGVVIQDQGGEGSNDAARTQFQQALALDSSYSKALSGLAWTYLNDYRNQRNDDPEKSRQLALSTAERAIDADDSEPDAHQVMGAITLYLKQHDECLKHLEKAVALNPNGVQPLMYLGWALAYAGEPLEGLRIMHEAILRDPFHPDWYWYDIGWADFVAERYAESIVALEKRTNLTNFTHLLLAINHAKLGHDQKAAEHIRIFEAAEPDYSIATAERVQPFKHPSDLEHYLDGLRKAGLRQTSPRS